MQAASRIRYLPTALMTRGPELRMERKEGREKGEERKEKSKKI
jgi:hypothetical protein